MIEIKEVTTKKDMRLFASYPIKLYKDCPYYVPSLRSDEMATFNPKKNFSLVNNQCKAFLCYKDGELVGRIAGLINHKHNEITGKKYIRFSRFDCIDDKKVFKALLDAVEKFGKEYGMEIIHGPWGFNDTDREGILTFGYNERSTYATNYSYPYFAKYMPEMGFSDESKWQEFNFKIPEKVDERIVRLSEKLMEKHGLVDVVKIMPIKEIAKRYGDEFFETYNDAYSTLDGFVPVEGDAKKNVLSQFATIINRRYASILVDKNGKIAAFGIVLPSICNTLITHKGKLFPTGFIGILRSIHKPTELEMALIAVKKEYRNSGINSILISNILQNIIADGIERLESNPMLLTNYDIQQQWKFAETEVIKKRQTYQKAINV